MARRTWRAFIVHPRVVYSDVPIQHVVQCLRAGVWAVVEFNVNTFIKQSIILYEYLVERPQYGHSCGGATPNLKTRCRIWHEILHTLERVSEPSLQTPSDKQRTWRRWKHVDEIFPWTHRSASTSPFSRNSASKLSGGVLCVIRHLSAIYFPWRIVEPQNTLSMFRNEQHTWYWKDGTYFRLTGLVSSRPRHHWNTIWACNTIRRISIVGHGRTHRIEFHFFSKARLWPR